MVKFLAFLDYLHKYLRGWEYPLVFFILGILPTGVPVLVGLFGYTGLCSGGIGSGIHCSVVFDEYFSSMSGFVELLVFLFPVWVPIAVTIWLYFFYGLLYAIVSTLGVNLLPSPNLNFSGLIAVVLNFLFLIALYWLGVFPVSIILFLSFVSSLFWSFVFKCKYCKLVLYLIFLGFFLYMNKELPFGFFGLL